MQNLLLVDQMPDELMCTSENCLTWLIILFNVFAVFYLVFCCFYKITNFVKLIGWVYGAILLIVDIALVATHTCIYTILASVFTVILLTAILAVVLPQPGTENAKNNGKVKEKLGEIVYTFGCYVIRKMSDGRYCYELYDYKNNFLVRSSDSYATVTEIKQAIAYIREKGKIANLEDMTETWIVEEDHPRFEIREKNGYFYNFSVSNLVIAFESASFAGTKEVKEQVRKAMKAVKSPKVYFSKEILPKETYLSTVCTKTIGEEEMRERMREEEAKRRLQEEREVRILEETVTPVPTADVASEIVASEIPVSGEKEKTGVLFQQENISVQEKYAGLSDEQKKFFDILKNAALAKEGVVMHETKNHLLFAIGRKNVLKLQIRRNTVEAAYVLLDDLFKETFASQKDAKVKKTETKIRVENEIYLDIALKTLDKKYLSVIESKK